MALTTALLAAIFFTGNTDKAYAADFYSGTQQHLNVSGFTDASYYTKKRKVSILLSVQRIRQIELLKETYTYSESQERNGRLAKQPFLSQ